MRKTLTFACVHFTVAFTVAYMLTGSVVIGGLVALVEPLCNTVAYHFHEMAWARWGNGASSRSAGDGDRYGAASFGCVH
ncbi:MAG: DUF2061 domain-containing protein [Defluviicoccus sp.]|jgi:uncharacterized membrane protein|uniref:DUF2061 domain-containing protein n=1 Tax=metagenome TaxID=256318 RepID=A0A380T9W9_9ZZZZ|nr:DUF2061 domain-containing protein [Defluviicoccus sp.]MDG4607533.1 DUF2061 domain-containing protein [Defluviicoccus sp.]SUS04390.1 conserved exported hypothetical protein [uncultured Defluviicoccus sp.]